ncbi:hypothetical protein OZ13_01395 [Xanthomonas cannabis pv. cannabis]|nr:hypothetical protein OZ10_10305 [Xanthomonas cannabis pv. cannabis]KHL59564.1 hypothetical protein OZ13_01395 [Xanthomonas cannabis pv. cannabis]
MHLLWQITGWVTGSTSAGVARPGAIIIGDAGRTRVTSGHACRRTARAVSHPFCAVADQLPKAAHW